MSDETIRPGLPLRTERLVHLYHTEGHDVAALSGVDLTVGAGEMIGLLGPSGSGKSTLVGLLGGLFRPSAGKVYVGGTEVSAATDRELDSMRAQDVSLMLQGGRRNLLPYYTLRENVAYAQSVARRLGNTDLQVADQVLHEVGLAAQADLPLATLASGYLQLGAVAVALASGPGVILADEPTSQLDHAARDLVLETLTRIGQEHSTTIVIVTHDPAVASYLPRTVTIRDGRIGGEGRSGTEYAVVTEGGFLPLPQHLQAELPPGTLISLHPDGDDYRLHVEDAPEVKR